MKEYIDYLKKYHGEDIANLLNGNNNRSHVSINVNLTNLQRHEPELYGQIISNIWEISKEWDKALLEAQKKLIEEGDDFLELNFQIKQNCHVRFINLPQCNNLDEFPNHDHVGLFVQVKANVVRVCQARLLAFKKEYLCSKCKEIYIFEATYERMYIYETVKCCPNPSGSCKGTLYPKSSKPNLEYCSLYQEIKIQEPFSGKQTPSTLYVTLENDLTDSCLPGDKVTLCGTIEHRWRFQGRETQVTLWMRATSVYKDKEKVSYGQDFSEQILLVHSRWQDAIDMHGQLNARDILVKSICPNIHGMYLIKLGIALLLCGGTEKYSNDGISSRSNSHMLLVGDPGLAKSKLIGAASKIAVRSVNTTGLGSTKAGLTVSAVKEEGEWVLEAGALVLADGGVCCIDEFNLMRESDKSSIHEAMEQQSISIAKAGIVCKLSTRCVVIAAANPKNLRNMSEDEEITSINIGISSSLLSRFDLVFILQDDRSDIEWETKAVDYILSLASKHVNNENLFLSDLWDLENLQSHFLSTSNLNPKLTPLASEILSTYYQFCRSDSFRDPSRTTARLLDSLNRLAEAHAKLLFREVVNSIDAIVVIRLMESSYGFGRMIPHLDAIKTELPIGPTEEQVHEILTILNLRQHTNVVLNELKDLNKTSRSPPPGPSPSHKSIPETPVVNNLPPLDEITKKAKNILSSLNVDIQEEILEDFRIMCSNPDNLLEILNDTGESNEENNQSILNSQDQMNKRKRDENDSNKIENISEFKNLFGYQQNTIKRLKKTTEKDDVIQLNQFAKQNEILNIKENDNKIHDGQQPSDDFIDSDDDFEILDDTKYTKNLVNSSISKDKSDNLEKILPLEMPKEFTHEIFDAFVGSAVEFMSSSGKIKELDLKKIIENSMEDINDCNDFKKPNEKFEHTSPAKASKSSEEIFKDITPAKAGPSSSKSLESNSSKKVSPATIKKLEMFKNPNYVEKNSSMNISEENKEIKVIHKNSKDNDSAYESVTNICNDETK